MKGHNQQPYLAATYKAIFAAGYYGLLRIGELIDSPHVILAENVHVGENKNKIMFILASSKMHNKADKPQIIKISNKPLRSVTMQISISDYCPYSIVKNYIKMRPCIRSDEETVLCVRGPGPCKACQCEESFGTDAKTIKVESEALFCAYAISREGL